MELFGMGTSSQKKVKIMEPLEEPNQRTVKNPHFNGADTSFSSLVPRIALKTTYIEI